MGKVISLGNYKLQKGGYQKENNARTMRSYNITPKSEDMDLEERLARVQESIKRIKSLIESVNKEHKLDDER